MRRIPIVLALAATVWLAANPLPVSAAIAPTLQRTAPYQAFGNLSGVGDCQYETAANIILAKFPKTKGRITVAQVIGAYNKFGSGMTGIGTLTRTTSPDLWSGQVYLISNGFAGHRASSITAITESQVVKAANAGGVEATVIGPAIDHMFAIIHADLHYITIVDDGYVYHYTWAWFNFAYTQNGNVLSFYAVTWAT